MGMRTIKKDDVFEQTSFDIDFTFTDKDGVEVTPSSLKVYIYLDEDPTEGSPTFINGRDGTDITGLTNSGANISFDMVPADNALADSSSTYEIHKVVIETFYNADNDKDIFEWVLKVVNVPYLS